MASKYYITGVSGTGKSAVAKVLRELGSIAFDLDEVRGLHSWRDVHGNTIKPPPMNQVDRDFVNNHKYCFSTTKLSEMMIENNESNTFYCGSASNQKEYLHLFSKVFVLDCRGAALRQRLAERPNAYGKHDSLPDLIEESNLGYVKRMRELGAIAIDSSRDLRLVVNDVLLHASLGEESRLCCVLEPGSSSDGWKAALRAAGHVVACTRQTEPDIVDESGKVTFRCAPQSGRSAAVDLGKVASLVCRAGPGPIFVADDSRNMESLMSHVDELFVLLRGGATYRDDEKAAIERALAAGAYAIDASRSAAEMAGSILAVAKRPGAGYVGGRRAGLQV